MMESVNVEVYDIPERKESIIEEEDDQLVKDNDTEGDTTQGQDVLTSVPTSGSNINTDANVTESSCANKGPSIRIQ